MKAVQTRMNRKIAWILILVAFVFYWPVMVSGLSPMQGDIPHQFLPWKVFWQNSILQGKIPLWNPHTACGCPFLANYQSGVFNPADWLLLWAPPVQFFGLSLVLHTILALLFTYGLARKLQLSPLASSLAALGYAFSGFNAIHLFAGNFLTFSATVWFPLLIWMSEGLVGSLHAKEDLRKVARWTLGLSVAIALQVLAGHPQMFFYGMFFTGLWLLYRCWPEKQRRGKRFVRVGAAVALAGAVAAMVCAVQLLPTLEYIGWSSRGEGLSFEEATQFSFSFSRLVALPLPDLFGSHATQNFWAYWKDWSSAYIGTWLPLLALIAVGIAWLNRGNTTLSNDSRRFPLAACLMLAAVAVFLALGRHNPVYRVVMMLPGFKFFRAPSKFLPYFILAVCLLAGRGWDLLQITSIRDRFQWRRWIWVLPLVLLLGSVVAILLEWKRFSLESSGVVLKTLGLAAGFYISGLLVLMRSAKSQQAWLGWIFLLILGADLYLYSQKYFQFLDPRPRWREMSGIIQEPIRYAPENRIAPDRLMEPNEAMLFGVEVAGYYDPLSVRHYSQWIRYYEAEEPQGFSDHYRPTHFNGPAKALTSLGCRLVIEPQGARWQRVESPYQKVVFYPAKSVKKQPYPWQIDPARELYLAPDEGPVAIWPPPTGNFSADTSLILPQSQPRMKVKRLSPEKWQIDYQSDREGFFYLSEVYYPGWVASVEGGEKTPIYRANYAFQAVRAPAGSHSIEVTFQPASFRTGRWLSGLGLIFLLIWFLGSFGLSLKGFKKDRKIEEFNALELEK